jgi:hypothetical protein
MDGERKSVTISKRAFGYVAFSVFLAAPALAQTRHGEPPSPTDALPLEVWVVSHQSGWQITFVPTGGAHAQYGSGFGDGGEVPAGTVDYVALVKSLSTAPATTALPPLPPARSIPSRGALRARRCFRLASDGPAPRASRPNNARATDEPPRLMNKTCWSAVLVRLNRQWKSRYGSSERLKELLLRYPIVSKEKQKDEPSLK